MILYIHGFASSGQGAKATLFRKLFKESGKKFLAPSLSFIPELALSTLEEIIETSDENITLMGSSLGGFYAIYLSQKYNLPAILINPSIKPYKTLKKVLGESQSFYNGDFSFHWKQSNVASLENFEVETSKKENYFLLVSKGDETLDYKEAVKKCEGSKMIIQEGSDHSFLDVVQYFDIISEFIKNH